MATKSEREEYARILKKREYMREYYRKHIDEERERSREKYAARKRDLALTGLCVACGKFPAVKGKTQCEACKAKMKAREATHLREHNKATHRHIERMNAQGLCGGCGKNPCAKGKNGRRLRFCEACIARKKEAAKAQREERIKYGVCTKCGKAPAREGKRMCFECARIAAEHENRRRHGEECPESFEGEEFYTGDPTSARCFGCEIPERYCTGENCVEAFRTWKKTEWARCKGD